MKKHAGIGIVLAATVALFATATPAFATPTSVTQALDLNQAHHG
jgi:hypothetical protein